MISFIIMPIVVTYILLTPGLPDRWAEERMLDDCQIEHVPEFSTDMLEEEECQ